MMNLFSQLMKLHHSKLGIYLDQITYFSFKITFLRCMIMHWLIFYVKRFVIFNFVSHNSPHNIFKIQYTVCQTNNFAFQLILFIYLYQRNAWNHHIYLPVNYYKYFIWFRTIIKDGDSGIEHLCIQMKQKPVNRILIKLQEIL